MWYPPAHGMRHESHLPTSSLCYQEPLQSDFRCFIQPHPTLTETLPHRLHAEEAKERQARSAVAILRFFGRGFVALPGDQAGVALLDVEPRDASVLRIDSQRQESSGLWLR